MITFCLRLDISSQAQSADSSTRRIEQEQQNIYTGPGGEKKNIWTEMKLQKIK